MVVDNDEPGRMMGQPLLDDPPRLCRHLVNCTFVHNLMANDFILCIEKNRHEGFVREPGQFHPGEVNDPVGQG